MKFKGKNKVSYEHFQTWVKYFLKVFQIYIVNTSKKVFRICI